MAYEDFALSASITATSSHASYPVTNLGNGYLCSANSSTGSWLSLSGEVTNQSIDFDFGSAKTFKKIEIVKNNYTVDTDPQDYELYVSDNGSDWTQVYDDVGGTLTDAVAVSESEILTLDASATALMPKRYLRVKFLNNYGDATYISCTEIMVYDDVTCLTGDGTTALTASTNHASYPVSAINTPAMAGYKSGGYYLSAVSVLTYNVLTWNFGSSKYINFLACCPRVSGQYEGKNWALYVSSDGLDWGAPFKTGQFSECVSGLALMEEIDFTSDPKYTQYLRLIVVDSWDATYGATFHYCRVYEADNPTDPVAPTSVNANGCGTNDIYIDWTHTELGNFDYYEVWEDADEGGYAKVGETPYKSFVRLNPSGTSFTYQIKAVNKVPETSSASVASDAATKGAAAGGGETSHTFS